MRVTVTVDDKDLVVVGDRGADNQRDTPIAPSSEWLIASVEPLSPRECEILRLVAAGLPYKHIGQIIGVSDPTVRTHVSNIASKVGLRSANALISWGWMVGLVNPSDIRKVWQEMAPHLVRKEVV
jgi:DNA-binding NarL/FixJ family response regulator